MKRTRKPEKKKKKSRRDSVKYPNLKQKFMPRIRSEFVDYDYLEKLSPEELEFLDKFTAEFHGASYQHDKTDIQSYAKYGKDSNDRNNAANRCLYGKLRSRANNYKKKLVGYENVLTEVENVLSAGIDPASMENAYVDFIESKELEEMLSEYDNAMLTWTDLNDISE